MKQIVNDLESSPLAQEFLNSLPAGVLVVDRDLRVVASNAAVQKTFGVNQTAPGRYRPGDVLSCLNALATEGGCGQSGACDTCLLRQSALDALDGGLVNQLEVPLELQSEEGKEQRLFLLTGSRLQHGGETYALVMLQDVTQLHRLRGMIPVCAKCKKVRRDDEAWEQIESYVSERTHAFFSHSLCPSCVRALYPELENIE